MSGMRCFTYIAWNNYNYLLNYSFDPLLDLKYYSEKWDCQQLQILFPALPLGLAYGVLQQLANPNEQQLCSVNKSSIKKSLFQNLLKGKEPPLTAILREKNEQASQILKEMGLVNDSLELYTPQSCLNKRLPAEEEKREVYNLLSGRALYLEEIENLLEKKLNYDLEVILQILFLEKKVNLLPAVAVMPDGSSYCLRCGAEKSLKAVVCLECGDESCCHCEECLSMGEAKLCRPLYLAANEHADSYKDIQIKMNFPLTAAQRNASRKLSTYVAAQEKKEILVWAACGAGKTEVTYAAIAEVLAKGGRVLYAVPRRQVVRQLASRMKEVFKNLNIAVFYGGNKENYQRNSFVIATTHQALRFYRNFDLVILDEEDAYPYRESRMLHYAVKRACKKDCINVYLTATPHQELKDKLKNGQISLITIPARHHGYPLPVPEIVITRDISHKNDTLKIPQDLLQKLHLSLEGDLAQVLIFVPTIQLTQKVAKLLEELLKEPPFNNFQGDWVECCHSKDQERDQKTAAFLNGDFPILVTTTIMERGITVPRVNVIVLFADNERIFDAGTLIQMAGRSGRLGQYPEGKVWFYAARKTTAMLEAVADIKKMNLLAKKEGYLLPGIEDEKKDECTI